MPSTDINEDFHYPLPSNEPERERLQIQNDLLLRAFGKLHVPVDLNKVGGPVLECGTGSGVWLCGLAKDVPTTTELIGVDIVPNLFPPQTTIPPNLTFKLGSVTSLPTEWTSKFTLIHQRFLFIALNAAEWAAAFNEMYRALKPGGWIQLFELDEWVNRGPELEGYNRLLLNVLKEKGIDGFFPNGYKKWKGMLAEIGFEDISITLRDSPMGKWAGRDGVDMNKNMMGLCEGFKDLAISCGGMGAFEGGEQGYQKWKENLRLELDEGATHPQCRWAMICARKPIGSIRN